MINLKDFNFKNELKNISVGATLLVILITLLFMVGYLTHTWGIYLSPAAKTLSAASPLREIIKGGLFIVTCVVYFVLIPALFLGFSYNLIKVLRNSGKWILEKL